MGLPARHGATRTWCSRPLKAARSAAQTSTACSMAYARRRTCRSRESTICGTRVPRCCSRWNVEPATVEEFLR